MATKPRSWPNNAEWCRMDCIALAHQGRKVLLDALDNADDPIVLRRITKAIEAFREIEMKLNSVKTNSAGAVNTSGAHQKESN